MSSEARSAATMCCCGHAANWHSYGGAGDCEHNAHCTCAKFSTREFQLSSRLREAAERWMPGVDFGPDLLRQAADKIDGLAYAKSYLTEPEADDLPAATELSEEIVWLLAEARSNIAELVDDLMGFYEPEKGWPPQINKAREVIAEINDVLQDEYV